MSDSPPPSTDAHAGGVGAGAASHDAVAGVDAGAGVSDARLSALIARATAVDGNPPFSDGALVEFAHGSRELVWLGDAAALVAAASAEFVVDPDARGRRQGTRMLERLAPPPHGEMLFWAHGDHPAARALAASHGLEPVRELLHLEADVPTGAEVAGPAVRAFDPARDADAWLDLNARAFASHPEQGAMTRADLETVMAQPWFDADDFLLLEGSAPERPEDKQPEDRRPGRRQLVGSSWLKVEGSGEGREGEFYVVAVLPDRQGEGWGRRLVEAGFARLASRGIRTAHLYVDGDNTAALALYRRLGFRDRARDVQYRWRGSSSRS